MSLSLRDVYQKQLVPYTSEQIKQKLIAHNSLDHWLRHTNDTKYNKSESRSLTHIGKDGKKYHISDRNHSLLLAFLAAEHAQNRKTFICQILNTPAFRFFIQMNILNLERLTDDYFLKLMKVVQQTMFKYFKKDIWCIWFQSVAHATNATNSGATNGSGGNKGKALHKYEIFIVWPNVYVENQGAQILFEAIFSSLKVSFPDIESPSNSWSDRLNRKIYNNVTKEASGGIQLPGCYKIRNCEFCSRKRNSVECKQCDSTGKEFNHPYDSKWVFSNDEKGDIDEVKTSQINKDWKLKLEWSHLRLPCHIIPRRDMDIPENAPCPPGLYDSESELEIDDDAEGVSGKPGNLSKKDKAFLGSWADFPSNVVMYLSKKKEFKNQVRDLVVLDLIEQHVQAYHQQYKECNVLEVRANKRKGADKWLIIIDGLGRNYCLNKGRSHTTCSIYFIIDEKAHMYHLCNYRKKPQTGLSSSSMDSHMQMQFGLDFGLVERSLCSKYRSKSVPISEALSSTLFCVEEKGSFPRTGVEKLLVRSLKSGYNIADGIDNTDVVDDTNDSNSNYEYNQDVKTDNLLNVEDFEIAKNIELEIKKAKQRRIEENNNSFSKFKDQKRKSDRILEVLYNLNCFAQLQNGKMNPSKVKYKEVYFFQSGSNGEIKDKDSKFNHGKRKSDNFSANDDVHKQKRKQNKLSKISVTPIDSDNDDHDHENKKPTPQSRPRNRTMKSSYDN